MQFEIDTVKGFQDFLPPESLKRKKVQDIIEKYYKLYGFVPVETPLIEFDEVMRSDAMPNEEEDEAVSDRFRLKDRGGRNLGLRYEFTFQLARIFKLNPNIKLPFRRYQIGPVLRDEPTGPGRFRQFIQCDADIIGDSSIEAEVECLALISDILQEVKVEAEIKVNNRQLLKSIIESVEIDQIKQVMRELDKLDKIGEDQVKVNLKKYTTPNQVITLFKLLEKPLSFFIENAFEGARELALLIEKAGDYGIQVQFNPTMIRGFGYYTGFIFEVSSSDKKGSIASGGRYDKVVGKYLNREIPAVGISFGLERLTEISQIEIDYIPKVILIPIQQEKETIKLSKSLRKAEISCLISHQKVSQALEYANSLQTQYVIFIGKDEIDQKKFKIRDMKSGDEELLTEKQIIKKLS